MLSAEMEESLVAGKRLLRVFFLIFCNANVNANELNFIFNLQCSAECGNGTRTRQRVCMKLFPRNQIAKTRKKGEIVSERHCQHMRQPPFIAKTKPCRKQMCASPKWEVTPWSRVRSKMKIFHNFSAESLIANV